MARLRLQRWRQGRPGVVNECWSSECLRWILFKWDNNKMDSLWWQRGCLGVDRDGWLYRIVSVRFWSNVVSPRWGHGSDNVGGLELDNKNVLVLEIMVVSGYWYCRSWLGSHVLHELGEIREACTISWWWWQWQQQCIDKWPFGAQLFLHVTRDFLIIKYGGSQTGYFILFYCKDLYCGSDVMLVAPV